MLYSFVILHFSWYIRFFCNCHFALLSVCLCIFFYKLILFSNAILSITDANNIIYYGVAPLLWTYVCIIVSCVIRLFILALQARTGNFSLRRPSCIAAFVFRHQESEGVCKEKQRWYKKGCRWWWWWFGKNQKRQQHSTPVVELFRCRSICFC